MSGDVRGWPLRRPVVVTIITGSPASTSGTLVRPFVIRWTTRSIGAKSFENIHAPARVEPKRCISRWNPLTE